MEQEHENSGNDGQQYPKRQPKPEEQALVDELAILSAQYGEQFPHICEFVQKEADRIGRGHKSLEEEHCLDVESGKPIRMTYKVSIPIEKYPNFNYVGRLLGPKGSTLKNMAEVSGCKLAILGKGSMKNKEREEQCRLEGGKYAHLNDDLHVWMQAFGPPDMAFYKLYVATKEIKKYLHADYNDEIFTEQMLVLEQEGGLPKGFTPRGRGTRGRGMRGNRGGNMMRGGMGGRGGGNFNRGGGMMRGVPRGRGGRGSFGRGLTTFRGGRAVHRGGANSAAVNADSLYEDVYEPVPHGKRFENGSATTSGAASAYFDEFPEPGTSGAGDGIGFSRPNQQTPGKQSRLNNHLGGGMPVGGGGLRQKAF